MLDEGVVAKVKAIAECTEQDLNSYKCQAIKDSTQALQTDCREKDKAIAMLETLSVLALDADAKLADAATRQLAQLNLSSLFPTLAKEPGLVSKGVADRLLKVLAAPTTAVPSAGSLVAALTKAITLAGQTEELIKVLDGITDKTILRSAYTTIMTYGRMAAWSKIMTMVFGQDPVLRAAGSKAPINMPKWTPEELTTICQWAKDYISDKDIAVATNIADIMVICRLQDDGKYIDLLLEEGKKRADAGEWKRPYTFAFRNICFGGMMGEADKPKPETCQKAYDFLESIANNPKVDNAGRGSALADIYYQRRDEVTLELMKKYENSDIEEIKKAATDAIKSIEANLKK